MNQAASLLSSFGRPLTSRGRAHCLNPLHEDKHPSMACYNNGAYCFSCGMTFSLARMHHLLSGLPQSEGLALYGNVRASAPYYQELPEDKEIKDTYITQRQEVKEGRIAGRAITLINKTINTTLPRKELMRLLSSVCVPTKKGTLLFPLWYPWNKRIVSCQERVYATGRNRYRFRKGKPVDGYFWKASKRGFIYVVEGASDALTMTYLKPRSAVVGVPSATTSKWKLQHLARWLKRESRMVCLVLDTDPAGQRLLQTLTLALEEQNALYKTIDLSPVNDVREWYIKNRKR